MALTNYVINFGSNFTSELGTLLTLNVEISNSQLSFACSPRSALVENIWH
jgi:hypothetical protein